jgi:hypothetical protein
VNKRKKASSKKDGIGDVFIPEMKRAFLGLPPISRREKEEQETSLVDHVDNQGSVVKFIPRPKSSNIGGHSSVAVDQTCSLFRLAQQIRSKSGTSLDQRRSGYLIIWHLGRGMTINHLEEEDGLIGLLESGSRLDASEPLSCAIASVQSQRRAETEKKNGNQSRHGQESTVAGLRSKKTESAKEILADCQRLHMLMHEAERGTF